MRRSNTQAGGITVRDNETTLTQKGQVTIPQAIRARLGLKPRDRVRFEVDGDEVKLKPVESKLLDGYGAVTPRRRPENWHQVRAETELAIAEEVTAED